MFSSRLFAEIGILGALLVVASSPFLPTPEKQNASARANFEAHLPEQLGPWKKISSQELEPSGSANEMYQAYFEKDGDNRVLLTLGYSSDERRSYELHYPDVCHRVRGDDLNVLPPSAVPLEAGRSLSAPAFQWHDPKTGDAAVSLYWFVIDKERITEVADLKWRQLAAGLLGRTFQGVLVRLDVFFPQNETWAYKTERLNRAVSFARDMYEALPPSDRMLCFGRDDKSALSENGLD